MQDYYATIYSAEIVNAMTNLMFVYLSYKGIRNCIRNSHDTVFLVSFVGYLIVGLGSFLFHSSLKCTSTIQSTTHNGNVLVGKRQRPISPI
jgi:dihydroceramidase